MRIHPLFAGPVPSFVPTAELVQAALDKFDNAYVASLTRDVQKVAAAKEARREVEILFLILARFYEAAAVTDPHLLDNTGFEVRREASATNPLDAQMILSVTHGKYPGVIIAKTAKVPGAASYEIHFTEGNPLDADWPLKKVYPNASHMEMGGLNGGSMYSVRGRVISGAGEGPWSDAVSIRAL